MAWTYDITAPVVGGKITAAGFGLQTDLGMAELQSAVDTRDVLAFAQAGRDVAGITRSGPSAVTTGAGITTVAAAPSVGTTRLVKSVLVHATAATSTVTLTLGATVLGVIAFASAGLAEVDTTIPLVSTDTNGLRVTMTGGTGYVTCSYVDRTDALVTRLGLTNGSTSGTLVASGTARTITGIWVGNPSTTTAATATVTVGGTDLLHAFTIPAEGIVLLDMPIAITNAQAVAWAGDSTTALTYMAVGH